MVGGQMVDLEAEGRWGPHERRGALAAGAKTGALFDFAAEAGAMLGRRPRRPGAALAPTADARPRVPDPGRYARSHGGDRAVAGQDAGQGRSRRARRPSSTSSASTARMRNAAASSPRPRRPWRNTGPKPISCARRPASRPSARLDMILRDRFGCHSGAERSEEPGTHDRVTPVALERGFRVLASGESRNDRCD